MRKFLAFKQGVPHHDPRVQHATGPPFGLIKKVSISPSKFNLFTNHACQLVGELADYIKVSVYRQMIALEHARDRPNRNRDAAIVTTFATAYAWLVSLQRLNTSNDFQAVASGSRAIFERYLDLKWLAKFQEPIWIERYRNFPNVDKYLACERVLKYKAATPSSTMDTTLQVEFMRAFEAMGSVRDLVSRVWGKKERNQEPRWPRHHWTGVKEIADRALALGPEVSDHYMQIYSPLSWLVHAGPTGHTGRDSEQMEQHFGLHTFYAFQNGREALITAVDALSLRESIPGFQAAMEQLDDWRAEALRTYPIRES